MRTQTHYLQFGRTAADFSGLTGGRGGTGEALDTHGGGGARRWGREWSLGLPGMPWVALYGAELPWRPAGLHCHGGELCERGGHRCTGKETTPLSLASGARWKKKLVPLRLAGLGRAGRKEKETWAAREKEKAQVWPVGFWIFQKRKSAEGKDFWRGFWKKGKTHKNMC